MTNVPSARSCFELMLVQLLAVPVRNARLRAMGVTADEAAELTSRSPLSIPRDLGSSVDQYKAILGSEALRREVSAADVPAFGGSTAHCFSLGPWPHLYWVVNRAPDGVVWGVGFQNQAPITLPDLDPRVVLPEFWTREALHRFSNDWELVDGWEESLTEVLSFGRSRFRAHFTLGLLDEWALI